MFEYDNNTSYILEKIIKISEVFMDMTIFSNNFSLEFFDKNICSHEKNQTCNYNNISKKELSKKIKAINSFKHFDIIAKCLHPDLLPEKTTNQLHELMEENNNKKRFKNPSIGLSGYDDLTMGIQFAIDEKPGSAPKLKVSCGTCFIYEYSLYATNHLKSNFPDLLLNDDLGSAGAFIDSFTYSTNLYSYKKFTFKSNNNLLDFEKIINNLISSVVSPCRKFYANEFSFQYNITEKEFSLLNGSNNLNTMLTTDKYFNMINEAPDLNIIELKKRNAVVCCLNKEDNEFTIWHKICHLTGILEDGKILIELHVPSEFKGYVEEKINNLIF